MDFATSPNRRLHQDQGPQRSKAEDQGPQARVVEADPDRKARVTTRERPPAATPEASPAGQRWPGHWPSAQTPATYNTPRAGNSEFAIRKR